MNRPMLFLRRSQLDFFKYLQQQQHFLSTTSCTHPHNNNSLQTLLKTGSSPTLHSINNLLLFLLHSRRFHFILHFFSQLTSNHHHLLFKPTSQTLSILTWSLLKLRKFDQAHLFVTTHMTKASFFPQTKLLDCLLQGLEPEKALLLLKICLRNGKGVVFPSSFTFCSLIYRFCYLGCMGRAMEVLELMNGGNMKYSFDNFVCCCVVSGFCRIGEPQLGVEFFENAVSLGGLRPNVVTYSVLVTALCLLGRVDESLLVSMENEGLAVDVVFYSSWIWGTLGREVCWRHCVSIGRWWMKV